MHVYFNRVRISTGAGKSSVILALLRIVELDSGSIFIDDRDISTLHLDALRRAISVIPQGMCARH